MVEEQFVAQSFDPFEAITNFAIKRESSLLDLPKWITCFSVHFFLCGNM